MGVWAKYQQGGLWGAWREFFAGAPWGVRIDYGGRQCCFSGDSKRPFSAASLPGQEVFRWHSVHGLSLSLWSQTLPSSAEIETWCLLLHYEAARIDCRPTFLPFHLPDTKLGNQLNRALSEPEQVLLFNGQPGSGKRTLLQGLSLLHAGQLPDLEPQAVNHWITPQGDVWVLPEVAMLELDVQAKILKGVRQGARVWAATSYDLEMLRLRKILSTPFCQVLEAARIHLPPASAREEEEVRALVDFWSALYGPAKTTQLMNFAFLKQQTVVGSQLSVGSILEEGRGLRGVIAEFEKEAIRQAYARVGRSQHKIARLLKVSRGSLQHKLRKYQLESYAPADTDTQEQG